MSIRKMCLDEDILMGSQYPHGKICVGLDFPPVEAMSCLPCSTS